MWRHYQIHFIKISFVYRLHSHMHSFTWLASTGWIGFHEGDQRYRLGYDQANVSVEWHWLFVELLRASKIAVRNDYTCGFRTILSESSTSGHFVIDIAHCSLTLCNTLTTADCRKWTRTYQAWSWVQACLYPALVESIILTLFKSGLIDFSTSDASGTSVSLSLLRLCLQFSRISWSEDQD